MINVSDELKNAVIKERMPKRMEVTVTQTDNLPLLNWYAEEYHGSNWYDIDVAPGAKTYFLNLFKFEVEGAINYDYVPQADYVGISCDVLISNIDPNSSQDAHFQFWFDRAETSATSDFSTFSLSTYETTTRFGGHVSAIDFDKFTRFYIVNNSSTKNLKCRIAFSNIKIYMFAGDTTSAGEYSDIFATETNVARYIALGTFDNSNIISQSFGFTESICSEERLRLGLCEASSIELSLFDTRKIPAGCDVDVKLYIADVDEPFEWKNFVVAESTKRTSGGMGVCDIVCYDRSTRLNQNAYAWYTKYMWGMNLASPQPNEQYKFDYCRQIYSTLHDLLRTFRIEAPAQYDPDHYARDIFNPADYLTQERYFDYTHESYVQYNRVFFCKKSYTHEEWADCLEVATTNQTSTAYWNLIDKFHRGVNYNACIYVDLNMSNGDVVRILGDSGDLLAIPPECETFDVYVPFGFGNGTTLPAGNRIFGTQVDVRQRKHSYYDVNKIVNGYKQLPYFSYKENVTVDDIVPVDSNITVRDIVRSICEMCGCFFRLDRQGRPTFLYASEHGLYPENTLFPADDLFPKKSSEMSMHTSYYIRAEYAEYQVSNYGGIQVIVNTSGNTGGVCRVEYWTDDDNDNAYVIDNNIFLCANDLVLETKDDILSILEDMFSCLDNLQYTPFQADTIGTPFLESGDRFTLLTKNDGFESFIFERKLKGIQALRDYFEARGIQKTPRVNNFEWED